MRYTVELMEDLKTRTARQVVFAYDADNIPTAVADFSNTAVGRQLAKEKVDELTQKEVDTNVK